MRNNMTTKYNQSAHATLKQAPMKPARDIIKTTKPTTRSGVCRKLSHVVLHVPLEHLYQQLQQKEDACIAAAGRFSRSGFGTAYGLTSYGLQNMVHKWRTSDNHIFFKCKEDPAHWSTESSSHASCSATGNYMTTIPVVFEVSELFPCQIIFVGSSLPEQRGYASASMDHGPFLAHNKSSKHSKNGTKNLYVEDTRSRYRMSIYAIEICFHLRDGIGVSPPAASRRHLSRTTEFGIYH